MESQEETKPLDLSGFESPKTVIHMRFKKSLLRKVLFCDFDSLQLLGYSGKHLVKAMWPVAIIMLVHLLLFTWKDFYNFWLSKAEAIAATLAFFAINYWGKDAVFGHQWRFVAEKFYSYDSSKMDGALYDFHLGLELVTMEIWYEESFQRYFKRLLQNALKVCLDSEDKIIHKQADEIVSKLRENNRQIWINKEDVTTVLLAAIDIQNKQQSESKESPPNPPQFTILYFDRTD